HQKRRLVEVHAKPVSVHVSRNRGIDSDRSAAKERSLSSLDGKSAVVRVGHQKLAYGLKIEMQTTHRVSMRIGVASTATSPGACAPRSATSGLLASASPTSTRGAISSPRWCCPWSCPPS